MGKVTVGFLTAATFACAVAIATLSWTGPVSAQEEHEHEREHRIERCVEAKRHHIQEMEERHEISHEEADRMRDHSHEECVREAEDH